MKKRILNKLFIRLSKIIGYEVIDQNNFVTFTMTPIVTGISGSFNIVGCGSVSKINNRRLDTGAIRIKDGDTLVLTGVIQETDVNATYKYPLLGDLPLLGALFRSKQTTNDKRELIILVTPRVLQDRTSNIADYNLKYENEIINSFAASELIQVIKNKLIFLGVDLTKISLNNIKTPMAFSDFIQKISKYRIGLKNSGFL